jgi:hypothetical protein
MRRAIFYGWVVVAVAGLVLVATAGVRAAPGDFLLSAWVAGVVRENVGDYAAAFVAAGWIAIIAGFAALAIRRRAPEVGSAVAPAT